MSDTQPTVLFYVSAEPGAAPFVRVPATPEGLRYAGYLARYKGLRFVDLTPERLLTPAELTAPEGTVATGYYGYPTNPGIPLGTERFVASLGDDPCWCRRIDRGTALGLHDWQPVTEGPPPNRGA